jgi:periplasmic protein TonB
VIQNNFIRWGISLSIGIIITLGLFWFMQMMIASDENTLNEGETYKMIDFVQMQQQSLEPEIKKELPPEPEKPKTPPKISNQVEAQNDTALRDETPLNIDMPNLGEGMRVANGSPKILSPMKIAKMDSVLTPMMQIKPIYPSRAKRMGVEGYVQVQLQVDPSGAVTSIEILKSVPDGVFDKSVKKALRRWKFRPKTVDGRAVAQKGVLTLNFSLGDK